jgi:peptidylprolyl isomerase
MKIQVVATLSFHRTLPFILLTSLIAGSAFAEALEGKPSPAEILAASTSADWRALDPENTLYIDLERGRVVVALSTQLAQAHVAQVKALAREGFYDGLSFYRVIDGFVAQGGDVFETREIRTAAQSMKAEFEEPMRDNVRFYPMKDEDGYAARAGFIDSLPAGMSADGESVWHLHCTGAFAFGRNNERDSASTEFYITLQPQRYLDRNLSVFGRVVQGMEHLQALRRVAPPQSENDDAGETILSIKVAADLPAEEQTPLEILDSSSETFAAYLESRRNRPEEFFYYRPNYIDICQLPIPVRETSAESASE